MSYTPTDWKTGDVITAEKLNNMEQGIVNAPTIATVTIGYDDNTSVSYVADSDLAYLIDNGPFDFVRMDGRIGFIVNYTNDELGAYVRYYSWYYGGSENGAGYVTPLFDYDAHASTLTMYVGFANVDTSSTPPTVTFDSVSFTHNDELNRWESSDW